MTTQAPGVGLGGLWSNWARMGGVAGILFLVLFIIGIIVQGDLPTWVAFAGGFLFLIMGATSSVFLGSLSHSFGVVEEADESAIRTLQYLDFFGFTNAVLALVPFFLASSLVIWQTGVFWRWLGLVGLLVAVLAAVAGASYFGSDPEGGVAVVAFIAGPIGALWLLVVSIAMIMKQEAPA